MGNLRHETITTFSNNVTQSNDAYEIKLKEFLNDKEKQITKINKQLNECRNVEVLRSCVTDLAKNIENNSYEGRQNDL